MKKGTIIAIVIVVLVLLYGFATYNSLVTLSVNTNLNGSKLKSYQRRFDLIPSLVESTKGIMKQEQAVFTAIADARTKYSGAQSTNEKAIAAGQLEGAIGRLLVITRIILN